MEWLLAVGSHRWLLSGRHYDHRAGRWTGEVAMLKAFADLFMRNKTRTVAGMPNFGPPGAPAPLSSHATARIRWAGTSF